VSDVADVNMKTCPMSVNKRW